VRPNPIDLNSTTIDYASLDAAVFRKAIEILEEKGWCSVKRLTEVDVVVHRETCLGLAVTDATRSTVGVTDVSQWLHEQAVVRELRVASLGALYSLNDSKTDEEGPKWAKDTLLAVIAKVEAAKVDY
jgi:hypothetical protein